MYNPKRTSLPIIDFSHHIIGRFLYFVSIYQCWVGLNTLIEIIESPQLALLYTTVYVLWVSLSLAALVFSDVSGYNAPQAYTQLVDSTEFEKNV